MNTENILPGDETQIRNLIQERNKAISKKDIDTVISNYADEVIVFDVVGALQQTGSNTVRTRLEEWFSSFGEYIVYESLDLNIAAGNNISFCSGLNHVSAIIKDGKKLEMWWRETLGLRKLKGKWLITHAHSSVPFEVQTGKASVGLKPEGHEKDIPHIEKNSSSITT